MYLNDLHMYGLKKLDMVGLKRKDLKPGWSNDKVYAKYCLLSTNEAILGNKRDIQ